MGSYLDKPETTKKSAFDENDYLAIGSSSMQGWRINQEDAHNAIPQLSENTSFFAVYDGHGGSEVAEYCSMKLPDFLKQLESFKNGQYEEALKEAFMGFDKTLLEDGINEELKQLAKKNPDYEDSEMDEMEEDETAEEIINLHQEATMPLSEVLEKYKGNVEKLTRIQNVQRIISFQQGKTAKNESEAGPSSSTAGGSSSSSPSKPVVSDSSTATKSSSDNEVSSSSGKTNSEDAEKDEPSSSNSSVSQPNINSNQTPDSTLVTIPTSSSSSSENNSSNEPNISKPKISNEMDSSECSSNGAAAASKKNMEEKNKTLSSDDAISSTRENGEIGGCSSSTSVNPSPSKLPSSSSKTTVSSEKMEDNASEENFEDTESDDDDDMDETYKESRIPKKKVKNDDSTDEDEDDDDDDDEVYDEEDEEMSNEEMSGEEDEDEDGLDDAFMNSMETGPGKASGCTAVVALLVDRDLYVANAGDSRCIVCRSGKVVEMSFDHKPEDQIEFQRIRKAGGRVTMDGRVNGGLNLSRAIGDHGYKMNKELPAEEQMITAMPDLKKITLTEEDEFMVLACDGIWNYMSNEEVVGFVKHRIDAGKLTLTEICEELFHNCLAPNTLGDGTGCDNMTAIIVKFKPTLFQLPASNDVSNSEAECIAHKRAHENETDEIVEPSDKKPKLDDELTPSTVDTSS